MEGADLGGGGPYLYLDATYLKANWGGKVVSVALLVAVEVSESGYRELLAVEAELPEARWQRCVVHFERNVLGQVPAHAQAEVAEDLKEVFAVSRRETAETLAEAFMARWGRSSPRRLRYLSEGSKRR